MTWQTELVEQLRYYINDIDESSATWTDAQLEKFLALGAIHVSNDTKDYGGTTFTVSVGGTPSISPDPTDSDDFLQSLIVVKASCIIMNATLKKESAAGGYKIIDDRSTIDTTNRVKDLRSVAESYCNAYQKAVQEFKHDNSFGRRSARFILAPFSDGGTGVWPNPRGY